MYTLYDKCPKCNGLGFEQESGAMCEYCRGKGYVETVLKRKHLRAMFPSSHTVQRTARKRRGVTKCYRGAG